MREKNPNPGARARFTTHEEVTTSRELTYRVTTVSAGSAVDEDEDEETAPKLAELARRPRRFTRVSPTQRAEWRSPAAHSRDNGVHDSLGKVRFTSGRDSASRTAEPSDTVARWERG